eukprot:m.8994 g.8994  ORF g.8994 m.8994 type:complete len:331 (-) comp6795_c0_seq1:44-1036(-)
MRPLGSPSSSKNVSMPRRLASRKASNVRMDKSGSSQPSVSSFSPARTTTVRFSSDISEISSCRVRFFSCNTARRAARSSFRNTARSRFVMGRCGWSGTASPGRSTPRSCFRMASVCDVSLIFGRSRNTRPAFSLRGVLRMPVSTTSTSLRNCAHRSGSAFCAASCARSRSPSTCLIAAMPRRTLRTRSGAGMDVCIRRASCRTVNSMFLSFSSTYHSLCKSVLDFPRRSRDLHARPDSVSSVASPFGKNSSIPRTADEPFKFLMPKTPAYCGTEVAGPDPATDGVERSSVLTVVDADAETIPLTRRAMLYSMLPDIVSVYKISGIRSLED